MYHRRYTTERPPNFVLNTKHPLAGQLRFAGLSGANCPGSWRYFDSSLYGNHGLLTGYSGAGNTPDAVWSRALGRGCLRFDGANDYVIMPVASPTDLSVKSFTVAMWAYGISLPTSGDYHNQQQILNVNNDSYGLTATPPNQWQLYCYGDGSYPLAASSVGYSSGSWLHLSGRYDGAYLQLYVNGSLVNSTATSVSLNPSYTGQHGFFIGKSNNSTSDAPRFWLGSLADVLVYQAALPATIIARLADPSNVMLDTGGGNCLLLPPRRRVFPSAGGGTTYTGSGSPSLKKATCSGAATFTNPIYTGSGSPTLKKATASASGTFTAPVYSGSGTPHLKKATSAASATFTPPIFSGSGTPSLKKATASGGGTFTNPVYTGSGSPTLKKATCSASGTFVAPTFSGSGSPHLGKVACAGVGNFLVTISRSALDTLITSTIYNGANLRGNVLQSDLTTVLANVLLPEDVSGTGILATPFQQALYAYLKTLPTSPPAGGGLYNSSGTLKIS